MPVVQRVVNTKQRDCSKCGKTLQIGEEVVKDRRDNKKRFRTKYYHTESCTV